MSQMIGVEIVGALGEWRLAYRGAFIGQEAIGSSDVLAFGDEVCEQLGVDRDSRGYVFVGRGEAERACRKVVDEVLRWRAAS